MTNYKTYEYIWLDGYKPESSMRSKVKATDAQTLQTGLLMVHQHNKQREEAQTVYCFQFKPIQILTDMI